MFCSKCGATLAPDGTCPNCSSAASVNPAPAPAPATGYNPYVAPRAPRTPIINLKAFASNKLYLVFAISIFAVIALLFIPTIADTSEGRTIGYLAIDAFNEVDVVAAGIFLLLAAAAAIFTGYGAYVGDKNFALYGSIAGAASVFLAFIFLLTSDFADMMDNVFDCLGIGFWLVIPAFAANIILSIKSK